MSGPRDRLIRWARGTIVNGQPVSTKRVVADILIDANNQPGVRVPWDILNSIRVTRNNNRVKRPLEIAKSRWQQGAIVVQAIPDIPNNPYAPYAPQQQTNPYAPLPPLQPPQQQQQQPIEKGFEEIMAQIQQNNPGLNIPQQHQNAPALPKVGPVPPAVPAYPIPPIPQAAPPAIPLEEKKDPLGFVEERWAFKSLSSLPKEQQVCVTSKENISRMLIEELDRLGGNRGLTWGLAQFANTRNKHILKFVGALFKRIIKNKPNMAARIARMYFDQDTITGSNPASRFYSLFKNQYDETLREDIPYRVNAQSFKFLQQMCQCTPSCNANFHTNCFSYATVGLSSKCDTINMINDYDYQNTRSVINPWRYLSGAKIKQ